MKLTQLFLMLVCFYSATVSSVVTPTCPSFGNSSLPIYSVDPNHSGFTLTDLLILGNTIPPSLEERPATGVDTMFRDNNGNLLPAITKRSAQPTIQARNDGVSIIAGNTQNALISSLTPSTYDANEADIADCNGSALAHVVLNRFDARFASGMLYDRNGIQIGSFASDKSAGWFRIFNVENLLVVSHAQNFALRVVTKRMDSDANANTDYMADGYTQQIVATSQTTAEVLLNPSIGLNIRSWLDLQRQYSKHEAYLNSAILVPVLVLGSLISALLIVYVPRIKARLDLEKLRRSIGIMGQVNYGATARTAWE